jgi:hypothetical protein
VENKTDKPVYAYWYWKYYYDGIERTEGNDENMIRVNLQPDESVEATCSPAENRTLRLFIQDKNNMEIPALTDFSMLDLNVYEL